MFLAAITGAIGQLESVPSFSRMGGRGSIAGSMIGGIAETRKGIDYCAARNIKADIGLIRPGQINEAFNRVVKKGDRHRFVTDVEKA